MRKQLWVLFIIILIGGMIEGCITIETGGNQGSVNTEVTPVQLNQVSQSQSGSTPTTQQQSSSNQSQQEPTPQEPTNTPIPCNKAKLVKETIPDNTQFDPGDTFTKTWTMRNDGSCTWDSSYRVIFNSGDRMGGETSYYLAENVKPGETIDLSMQLTAPDDPGTYKGYWNIKAPDGDLFTYFFSQIEVVDNTPPFAVTAVTTNLSNAYNPGACPYALSLKVSIKANGPGTVNYRIETSDLGMQASQTLTFASASTKTISYTWTFTYSSAYWIKVHIDDPNHQTFGPFNFTVNCP